MVLPIADDNSDRTTFPVVNVCLIAINVLVFVVFQDFGQNDKFTLAFSTVPAEILSGRDVVTEDRVVTMNTAEGQRQVLMPGLQETPIPVYLTLLTAMFMHGGIAHLLGNMWFLWIFGDNIEHDLGRGRYVVFYLLCGILASLAHVMLNTEGPNAMIPSLGASGAISGVMGAYMLLHANRRVTVLLFRVITQVPGYVAVGIWFLFQVISGMGIIGGSDTGVAYGAHIGGFLAGLLPRQAFHDRAEPHPRAPVETLAATIAPCHETGIVVQCDSKSPWAKKRNGACRQEQGMSYYSRPTLSSRSWRFSSPDPRRRRRGRIRACRSSRFGRPRPPVAPAACRTRDTNRTCHICQASPRYSRSSNGVGLPPGNKPEET